MECYPLEYRPLENATNAELAEHYRHFMSCESHECTPSHHYLSLGDVLDEVFAREIMLNQLEEM